MSLRLRISELPGVCWPNAYYPELQIDRSGVKVREFLVDQGVEWTKNSSDTDIFVRKAELTRVHFKAFQEEFLMQEKMAPWRVLYLIGEPRELAPMSYMFADPQTSLAVAPGQEFKRMQFCAERRDPQLEGWKKRENRICWIGRPIEERVRIAQRLIDAGVPLDIYSHVEWPVSAWRGPAEDDVQTALQYKYRIVCENSRSYGYHSEKLFTSIRSGCVSFYLADPQLELTHLEGAYLPLSLQAINSREDLAESVLKKMEAFMFSDAWEIYSPKLFYERIIQTARQILNRPSAGEQYDLSVHDR